jgi:hypothetical protein
MKSWRGCLVCETCAYRKRNGGPGVSRNGSTFLGLDFRLPVAGQARPGGEHDWPLKVRDRLDGVSA